MHQEEVPVLIAGGGLVGLSTGAFLAGRGVQTLVVERHAGTSILPRGRMMNVRSMEVFRANGLEEAVRAAPPSMFNEYNELARVETLAGREVFRQGRPPMESLATASPCLPAFVDQQVLEPIILHGARARGAQVRFGTALRTFAADQDGVTALVEDLATGTTREVRARYLVGADGHRSPVRETLGIGRHGPGLLSNVANIVFEADLSEQLRGRKISVCYVDRPEPNTMLAMFERPDHWLLMVPYHPDRGDDLAGFTEERCREVIRQAIGTPGLQPRIMPSVPGESRLVQPWELAAWVADSYGAGRVFLAGDAAHVVSPAGGFGANTGVQDAGNLAWKLAAVLSGAAGEGLLRTYEAERLPVAEMVCAYSTEMQNTRSRAKGDAGASQSPMAVAIGYAYRSDGILGAGPIGPPVHPDALTGEPGTRAPHMVVEFAGREMSTLDLYRLRPALIAGPAGAAWSNSAAGLPIDVHRIGGDLTDPEGCWAKRHGVADDGAVLVRPDGHIAWRSIAAADRPDQVLTDVVNRVLAR
jgi:putative polyketide hydroxylase